MKKTLRRTGLFAAGSVLALSLGTVATAAEMSDKDMFLELKAIIEQQQEQLSKQAAQIESLQQKVGGVAVAVEQKADKEELAALEVKDRGAFLNSGVDNVDVTLYGQINKAYLFSDNGDSSKSYFVDNANSSSRLGLNLKVGVSEDFTVGGKLEYEFLSSASNVVNQLNTSNDADFKLRHADIFFNSDAYGKISLGLGSMAADGSSQTDLSGTSVVTYVSIGDMAGGQLWDDGTVVSGAGSDIGDVYKDLDGGRKDRFRYDTPSYHGLMLSAAAAADSQYDLALRYNRKYDSVTVASAIAWQNPNDGDVDSIYNGSVSLLFNNGINATLAAGTEDSDTAEEGSFWYTKLGYQIELFEMGTTAFSIDYGQYDDFAEEGGEATVYSVAAVQKVDDWGTEFYLGVRQHEYDENSTDYDDIFAVMSGARLKF